jgi:hypothetical protein
MDTQTPTPDEASPAPPPPAPSPQTGGEVADPTTHFMFKHRIFGIDSCRFALNGSDKLPCFYVPMGEQIVAIELRKLEKEFRLEKEDIAILKTVEKGLKYVKDIRPNDTIPREILDGSASWSVEDKHKDLAKARLNQEMIFWIDGFRGDFPSLTEMQRHHKDQEGRLKIRDAHVKLTQLLGLKDPRITAERFELLIRETPYVEALRERAAKLGEIAQKLVGLSAANKKETAFIAEVMRMQDLQRRAMKMIAEMFEAVDGALKEVPKALGDTKACVAFVREARDNINAELKKWEEHFDAWDAVKGRDEETEKYFRKFYQFLAENYMEQAAWSTSPQGAGNKKKS